jgi:hypothetical protein
MSITLETKVWENDWELVLKTSRLRDLVSRCNYSFDQRILYINNVKNPSIVEAHAQRLINEGVIDQFVHVHEHAKEALDFFQLNKEKLGKGYYYSIAELVSIYLTKTKYLLHFSSDAIPEKNISSPWVQEAIELLSAKKEVKVFNLTWDHRFKEVKNESIAEDAGFFYGYGFSDQMYLIRTEDFRAPIYEETNEASNRYPKYGGELFEKRIDSWMRNHSHIRASSKKNSYIHKNFPKNYLLKKLNLMIS